MSFNVLPTPRFERSFKALAKRHCSLKQDILEFIASLSSNPFQGDELCPNYARSVWRSPRKGAENRAERE